MSTLSYTLTVDPSGGLSLSSQPNLKLFRLKSLPKGSHPVIVFSVLTVPTQGIDKQGLLSIYPRTTLSEDTAQGILDEFSQYTLASGVLSGHETAPNGAQVFYTNEIHLLPEYLQDSLLEFLSKSGIITV